MIIVNKNGELYYKNQIYKCALGKNGISENKKEGDGCTPAGTFSLGSLYFRRDRINNIDSNFKAIPIKSNMFWSDHSPSKYYNQLINFRDISCEQLFKENNTYDIFLVINYNYNPILKGKGSAIFMHIAKENLTPTAGCVALKKNCLINLLKQLNINDKIKILL
ncbi:MAG: transpeptidase [Rickettsiales bacterium]|nr:transpeptidase [Rickettsiales bacterium]OUV79809.1 MAG: transpeptidase [Rickettsiales bacterium TMED131]